MVGEWLGVAPYPLSMPLPSLVADVDVHCFSHEGFGVGGALRPEAIVQVALQVAFYRYGGEGLSIRGYTAWWLGGRDPGVCVTQACPHPGPMAPSAPPASRPPCATSCPAAQTCCAPLGPPAWPWPVPLMTPMRR